MKKSGRLLFGVWGLAILAVALLAPNARAQQTAVLKKEIRRVESRPGVFPIVYVFSATISGTASEPSSPVSITRPGTGRVDLLVFDPAAGAWKYEVTFSSQAALTLAFPNGTYTLTFGGRTVPVAFSGDLFPAQPSFVLLNSRAPAPFGTDNGVLIIDRTVITGIQSSVTDNFLAGSSRLAIGVTNVGGGAALSLNTNNSSNPSSSQVTLSLPPNSFVAGGLYRVEGESTRTVTTDLTSAPGFTVSAVYSSTLVRHWGVEGPPAFFTQPQSVTRATGGSVVFAAVVGNPNGITYQWQKNGAAISGATNTTLTFAAAQATDAGSYTVIASNNSGSTTSAPATLTLTGPPNIVTHPASFTVSPGSTVVLEGGANGATSFSWRRDGTTIPGATASRLVLTGANVIAGSYTFLAGNSAGTTPSNPGTLATSANPDSGRLSNLAIRSNAGTGAQTLIVGFAVGGAGTTGTKPLLVRGVGPSLTQFGLAGVLNDPVATVFQGSTTVATNDNWAGDAQVIANGTRLGAFGFSAPTSLDSAFVASPTVGSYSVQITGRNNGTGIALAEIYDASVPPLANTTPRLVNVSARTQVGIGGDVLIAGFNIGGTTARTVLIRAIGPELGVFGVGGTLTDPKIQLFAGTTVLHENDDWGGDPQIVSLGSSVGAFALSNAASKDAAALISLSPGAYTAQVSGAGGTAGVALIEVYEIP